MATNDNAEALSQGKGCLELDDAEVRDKFEVADVMSCDAIAVSSSSVMTETATSAAGCTKRESHSHFPIAGTCSREQ